MISASPGAGGRKDITVLEAMDQARANLPQLAGQPGVETALRYTIGMVYAASGSLPKAEDELKRAKETALRLGSEEDVARVNRGLASLAMGRGDWHPAEAYIRQALGYVRKAGPRADPVLAHDCAVGLFHVLWWQHGHSPEAESSAREGLGIARATPRLQGFYLALDLASLGMYLQDENRPEEAGRLLNEALEVQRGLPHVTTAMCTTLGALGMAAARRGDLAAAERYYRESRDTTLRIYGLESLNSIAAVGDWGHAWADLGHAAEAAPEIAKALDAGRKLFPSGSPRLSSVYADYAHVLNVLQRSKEAESYARHSLDLWPADVPATSMRRAEAQLELGISLTQQRRFPEARPFLEQAERSYANDPGYGPAARETLRAKDYLERSRDGGQRKDAK